MRFSGRSENYRRRPTDRRWQVAKSAFFENRWPFSNSLRDVSSAATPNRPPNQRERIRIEFADGHGQSNRKIKSFDDPVAEKSECDGRHDNLSMTDG